MSQPTFASYILSKTFVHANRDLAKLSVETQFRLVVLDQLIVGLSAKSDGLIISLVTKINLESPGSSNCQGWYNGAFVFAVVFEGIRKKYVTHTCVTMSRSHS